MDKVLDLTTKTTPILPSASKTRPRTAGSSIRRSGSALHSITSSTTSSLRSTTSRSRSRVGTSGSQRPSTASATSSVHGRRMRKRPSGPPTVGITYQQSAGNSGARDDLRVVYKIIDREELVRRIKKNATEYLTHHRWEAVSVGSSMSSMGGGSGVGGAYGSSTDSVRSTDAAQVPLNSSKGAMLIESIRNDLLLCASTSLKVVWYVWLWRQDQMLTLHERQNPSLYPPRPFVYNGHDYILKMINDLNFLKDVQPITQWLGSPLSRNPFSLLSDDPNCLDNLDMQFEGSLAELAGCSHIPPPPSITLELGGAKLDPLCVKWSSLLILAQEAIYGKGQEGSSLMTGYASTMNGGGVGGSSSSSTGGRGRGRDRGGGDDGSSTMSSTAGFQLGNESMQVTRSLLSENGSISASASASAAATTRVTTTEKTEGKVESRRLIETKYSENIITEEGGKRDAFERHQLKTTPTKQRKTKRSQNGQHLSSNKKKDDAKQHVKIKSKVKNTISQNASLRHELVRLRKQLEMERETLYQLEKSVQKTEEE